MRSLNAEPFDARLDRSLRQPLAVAFSGGGDSLAALIAAVRWAKACGREVIALHVDHRVQPASGAWAGFARETAARLGAGFVARAWCAPKPARGLAAAARRARHSLIAGAAREVGASVVVFGHTADDLAESAVMRAEGSTLGALGVWRPSPVWPEGRGVMLFRPLLRVRRAAIRAALAAEGWTWVEDPANADLHQPRARARRGLAADALPPHPAPDCTEAAALARGAVVDDFGAIALDRARLLAAEPAAARQVLAAAMLSAAGGERPPRRRSVSSLFARLTAAGDACATLAGARLSARGDRIWVTRDAGEARRGGLAPAPLDPESATVWDGRFEIATGRRGGVVTRLGGSATRLEAGERRRLAAVPAAARAALPLVTLSGAPTCPILARESDVGVRSLVGTRFLAACGATPTEPLACTDP